MQYAVPGVEHSSGTVIAVNVGGAVIPTLMSVYLLITRNLWVKGAIAIAIVALVLHWLAYPVPGIGCASSVSSIMAMPNTGRCPFPAHRFWYEWKM